MFLFPYKGYTGFNIIFYCSLRVIFFGMLLLLLLLFLVLGCSRTRRSFALERGQFYDLVYGFVVNVTHLRQKNLQICLSLYACVCVCVRKLKLKPSLALRNEGFALFFFVVVIFGADLANSRAEKKSGKKNENIKYCI